MPYMLMLVAMTLDSMQGHSRSAKANHQRCMLSATKQTLSIKLSTTVGHFLCDLDLDFANVYMACPSWCVFFVVFFYNLRHTHSSIFLLLLLLLLLLL